MRDLLEYLARGLVEHPGEVRVNEVADADGSIVLELSVAEGDYGSVIGRGGRTAQALRTIIKAASARDERRVFVDIVDDYSVSGQQDAAGGLRAGTVGRAHGLDGSFHLGAVAETVFSLLAVGSEVTVGGQTRRIARLAGHGGRPIVRLEGAQSREDADALRGEDVWVARSLAPALDEDEWWAADLEGCAVRDGAREVGTVVALLGLPSCEVLEVRRAGADGGPALLVPLVRDAVREVDVAARVIDIDLRFLGEA